MQETMRSEFCSICSSKNIEVQNIEVSEQAFASNISKRQVMMIVCFDCGHASRCERKDLASNLSTQKLFFDKDASRYRLGNTKWPHRPALVAGEVRRIVGNSGKALDIGCSTGLWLATLGDSWVKHGVELSSVAARIAKELTNAEVFCGPIESYKTKPESFDLITAFAVIEHVFNPRIFVKWTYEHLKQGGLLVLMTGDRESQTASKMGSRWPMYSPVEHIHFFSARSLCRLVESIGYKVVRKEWRFMYMPWGMGSAILRAYMKTKELLRLVSSPLHDHFYLYARKV